MFERLVLMFLHGLRVFLAWLLVKLFSEANFSVRAVSNATCTVQGDPEPGRQHQRCSATPDELFIVLRFMLYSVFVAGIDSIE